MICNPAANVSFAPAYKANFADNSWDQIIAAVQNNEVPDTWTADGNSYKDMEINGANYRIDIIGKNHDTYSTGGGKAPLTFQLHDCYNVSYPMNSTRTNTGGWLNCEMRTVYLPAILKLMPTIIQNNIKEVQKLTSAGNNSSSIITSNDKLFLLSEIEIFEDTLYSFTGEGNQYNYYRVGNSTLKNYYANPFQWWQRSPATNNLTNFCVVGGTAIDRAIGLADNAYGVAFAFCF